MVQYMTTKRVIAACGIVVFVLAVGALACQTARVHLANSVLSNGSRVFLMAIHMAATATLIDVGARYGAKCKAVRDSIIDTASKERDAFIDGESYSGFVATLRVASHP